MLIVRAINKITINYQCHIPQLDDTIDTLVDFNIFCK